ncbi:MAG: HIT family protein [Lysobacterales bacterium]
MLELPIRDPCDLCEGIAGRADKWGLIEEHEHTLTVINPWQFETGQCCVITRRHVATLLDLSDQECQGVMESAKRAAHALVKTFDPLGILTFQNNGVYSGQETPKNRGQVLQCHTSATARTARFIFSGRSGL